MPIGPAQGGTRFDDEKRPTERVRLRKSLWLLRDGKKLAFAEFFFGFGYRAIE